MSLHLPVRRVAGVVRSSTPQCSLRYLHTSPVRLGLFDFFGAKKPGSKKSGLEKAIDTATQRRKEAAAFDRMHNASQGESIFDDEANTADGKALQTKKSAKAPDDVQQNTGISTLREHMARAVDPDPRWRVRYQKRKVMQMVRSNREPTRQEIIDQTERQVTSQSDPLPTSTKKLIFLARQIQGKTVDEAIVQMKLSKKKIAREVLFQLERAKEQAVVAHGMGLGRHTGEVLKEPKQIITKDGKRIAVSDPTDLYVDESWIGKGPWRGMRIHYRARSQSSAMWKPTTRLTVVLKEEKTRIRQHDEKEAKKKAAKPWVHHPNRPVTAQRPYYTW